MASRSPSLISRSASARECLQMDPSEERAIRRMAREGSLTLLTSNVVAPLSTTAVAVSALWDAIAEIHQMLASRTDVSTCSRRSHSGARTLHSMATCARSAVVMQTTSRLNGRNAARATVAGRVKAGQWWAAVGGRAWVGEWVGAAVVGESALCGR